MSRDEHGLVSVVPTEGGHLGVMLGLPGADRLLDKLQVGGAPVTAETLFSGLGLLSTYISLRASRASSSLHNSCRVAQSRGDEA
jgi:glucokinase